MADTRDLSRQQLAALDDAALVERTALAIEAWRRSYRRDTGRAAPADETEEELCSQECGSDRRQAGLYDLALSEANRRRDERLKEQAAATEALRERAQRKDG